MTGTNMTGTNMTGTNMTGTNMTGTLPGAKWHAKCFTVRKPSASVTRAIALLLLVCLTESASAKESSFSNSRIPEKLRSENRGQRRGGSCLSYGHSCWGAHGKRSGPANEADSFVPPRPSAPENAAEAWYFSKVLGRLPPNLELVHRNSVGSRGIDGESLSRADIGRLWQNRRVAQQKEDENSTQDKFNTNAGDNIDVDGATAAFGNTRQSSSDDVILTGRERTDRDRLLQIMREAAEEK